MLKPMVLKVIHIPKHCYLSVDTWTVINSNSGIVAILIASICFILSAALSVKMPCLKIVTNLPKCKVPSDFVDKIVPTLAAALRKPEQSITCAVSSDAFLHIEGDSKAPGAVASLESCGNLEPESNAYLVNQICSFVEKELGIPPKRILITLHDLAATHVGKDGTTLAVTRKQNV